MENASDKVKQEVSSLRAIALARVSTDDQGASGLGIAAQLHACREWALRNGAVIATEFIEDGVSGATNLTARPQMIEAITSLERGGILLVAKRDRLGRDPMVIAMIEAAVAKKRGRIISAAGEGTESDEPSAVLMRRMIDGFGEYERLIIRARTKAALAAKRRRGERVGSVPYGSNLDPDGRTLRPNDTELALAGLMAQWRALGMSYRQIAAELNRQHVPTKKGREWRHSSVVSILRREAV